MSIFRKKQVIDYDNIPNHIAFIMDGNGRWATRRGLPRNLGHREGANAIIKVIDACIEFGVKITSFFMFSTENWKRPQQEIDYIFDLASDFSQKLSDEKYKNIVKIVTMGDLSAIPQKTRDIITDACEKTRDNSKIIVNVGVNYGGRDEIVLAVNNILKDKLEMVDKAIFNNYLYTKSLKDPDLVVRSSGEQRVSNFMMYQMAYSEFYFIKKHWPDFDKKTVNDCILEFQKRNRRFGGLN